MRAPSAAALVGCVWTAAVVWQHRYSRLTLRSPLSRCAGSDTPCPRVAALLTLVCVFHVHRELLLPWVLPVLLLFPLSHFSGADAESRYVRRHHGTPFPALASSVGCWYLGGEPSPPPPAFHPTTVGACATMAWTFGASRCSECGVTKANPAAMRRHTLTQHRHLGRNANRRLPPQQHGPDPAVGQAGAAAAARQGAEASPAASCPPASSRSR